MAPIWTGILQLGIWESILLLCYHGMSTVLILLQKPQEFSIFFAVLCTAVQEIQPIFVLPILEYACQAWNPHTQKCIKQLESIQCRGAKWVCGAQYNSSNFTWTPSSSQCCARLKWLTMADRRKFRIILFVHDILHQRSCIDFNTYFTVRTTRTRSHSLSLFCRQASINSFRYSFFVNGIFLWNCISHSILSISGRNSFKSQLYSFLFGVAS